MDSTTSGVMSASISETSKKNAVFVIAVCCALMMLEGVDIQVLGIVAPELMPRLGINKADTGTIFAMTQVGGVLGALLGGRYSDVWGRRNMLFLSVAMFGVFTFATIFATDFLSMLVIRTLAGVGIGAAVPNVVGLAVEAAPQRHRVKAVTIVMAGMPIGGAAISFFAASAMASLGWKSLFYIGGLLPLALLPLLLFIPNKRTAKQEQAGGKTAIAALFKDGRHVVTMLVWVIFLLTGAMIYLLLNWLPTLMTERNFTITDGQTAAFYFNLGCVGGGWILGSCIDRFGPKLVLPLAFLAFIVGLAGMALSVSLTPLLVSITVVGFFVMGAYYCLNGVTALLYPEEIRGLGVGSALAVGRVGSIGGPLIAGLILQAGGGPGAIVVAMIPAVIVATLAVSVLMIRKT